MEDLFASLVKDFVDEAEPLAQKASALVLKLEQASGEATAPLVRALRGELHTLKGNSAMMGLSPLEQVAHRLEDVCADVAAEGSAARRAQIQLLLDGCDLLLALIRSAPSGAVDAAAAEAFLQRSTSCGATPRGAESSIVDPTAVPAPGAWPVPAVATENDEGRASTRIADDEIDGLLELAGETIVGQIDLTRVHSRLARGRFEPSDIALMDQILLALGRCSRDMRHRLLRLRLAPIAMLFRRFERFVRDLGHERGQTIELVIQGGETAVDRAIISRLYEPLVHIVRNAVAHGIEPAAERASLGKPQNAQILLAARLREGRVHVSVADDGRGLDLAAIAAKAKAQGIDTANLAERDVQRLIFQAGLSTASSVSKLAGRGVGLDVVASVVQGLGGSIDVRSSGGGGTTFVLDLPVTVSLQKALIFGVDSETFAIPTGFVVDTLPNREKDLQAINRVLLCSWRGDFVRATDAGRLLGCQGLAEAWARPYAIVMQAGNKRGALLVDWLSGVQEIVVKPLDETFASCAMIAGATVLAQGRVVPILDCVDVVRRISAALLPEAPKANATETRYDVF
jgi:two-component system chemotaxis sensor kinase CheA